MGQKLTGAGALAVEVGIGATDSLLQAELALSNMTDLTDRIDEIDMILANPGSDESKQLIANYEGEDILQDSVRLQQYMTRLKDDRVGYMNEYDRLSQAYDKASETFKETIMEDRHNYNTTDRDKLYKRLTPIATAIEREEIEIARLEGERKQHAETVWLDPEVQAKSEHLDAADKMQLNQLGDWDIVAADIGISDTKKEQLRGNYETYIAARRKIDNQRETIRELNARKERELGVSYTYDDDIQNREDAKIKYNAAMDRKKELEDQKVRGGGLNAKQQFEYDLLMGKGELKRVSIKGVAEGHYRNIDENIARMEKRLNELKADDRVKEFTMAERDRLKTLRKELRATEQYTQMRRVFEVDADLSREDKEEVWKSTQSLADLKHNVDVLEKRIKTPKERDFVVQQQRLDRLMRFAEGQLEGDIASKIAGLQWGGSHRIRDEWELSLLGTRRTMYESEQEQAGSFDRRVLEETSKQYKLDPEAARLSNELKAKSYEIAITLAEEEEPSRVVSLEDIYEAPVGAAGIRRGRAVEEGTSESDIDVVEAGYPGERALPSDMPTTIVGAREEPEPDRVRYYLESDFEIRELRKSYNKRLKERYKEIESEVRSDPNRLLTQEKSGVASGGGGGLTAQMRDILHTQVRRNQQEIEDAKNRVYNQPNKEKAETDKRLLSEQRQKATALDSKKRLLKELLLEGSYMSATNAAHVKQQIRQIDISIGNLHANQSKLPIDVQHVLRLETQGRDLQAQLTWQGDSGGGKIQIDQAREALQKQADTRMKLTEADRQLLARYGKLSPQWRSQSRQVEEQYGRRKQEWADAQKKYDIDSEEYKREEALWNEAQAEYTNRSYRLSLEVAKAAKENLRGEINRNDAEYQTYLQETYQRTQAEMRAWHKAPKRSKKDIDTEQTGKKKLIEELKELQGNRLLVGKEREDLRRRMGTDPTLMDEYRRKTEEWAELNRDMIQKSDDLTGFHKRLKNLDPDYVIDTPQEVKDFRHERFERYRRGEPDIDQETRDVLRSRTEHEREIVEGMQTHLTGWEKILATSFTTPPVPVTDAEVFVEARTLATKNVNDQVDSDNREITRLNKEILALQKIRDKETDPEQIRVREAEIRNLETQREQRHESIERLSDYDKSNYVSTLKERLRQEQETLTELKLKRDQHSILVGKISKYEAEELRIRRLEQQFHNAVRDNDVTATNRLRQELTDASEVLSDRLQKDNVDITSLHIQQQELESELFNQKKGTIGQVNKLLNGQQKKIDDLEKEIETSEEQFKAGELVIPYRGELVGTTYEEAARKNLQERYESDKKVYDQVQQYISLDFDEDSKKKLRDIQTQIRQLEVETKTDYEGDLQLLKKQQASETQRLTKELQERLQRPLTTLEREAIIEDNPEIQRIRQEITRTIDRQERQIREGYKADKEKLTELNDLQAQYVLAIREADEKRIAERKKVFKAIEGEQREGETPKEVYERLVRPRLEEVFREKVTQRLDSRQTQLNTIVNKRSQDVAKTRTHEQKLRDELAQTNQNIDRLPRQLREMERNRDRLVSEGLLSGNELDKANFQINNLRKQVDGLRTKQAQLLSDVKAAQDASNKAFFDHRDAMNDAERFRSSERNKLLVSQTDAAISNFLTRTLEVTETGRGLSRLEAEIGAKIDVDIDFEKGTLRTTIHRPETQIAGGWQSITQVEGAEAQTEPAMVPGRSGELVEVGFAERFPVPYYQAQRKFMGTKKQIDAMIEETEIGDKFKDIRDKLHYIRTAERMVQRHDDYRKYEQLGERLKDMGIVLPEREPPIQLKRQIIRSLEIEDNIRKLETRLEKEPDMKKADKDMVTSQLNKLRRERGDRETKQELRTRLAQKISDHNDTVKKEMVDTIALLTKQRALSNQLKDNLVQTLEKEQLTTTLNIPTELTPEALLKKDFDEVQETYKNMLAESVVNAEMSRQEANAYLKTATDEYLAAIKRTSDQLPPGTVAIQNDIGENRRLSEQTLGDQRSTYENMRSLRAHRHQTLIPEKLRLEEELRTLESGIQQRNSNKETYVNNQLAEVRPKIKELRDQRAAKEQELAARKQVLLSQGHTLENINRDDAFTRTAREVRQLDQQIAVNRQNLSYLESLQADPTKLAQKDITPPEEKQKLSQLNTLLNKTNTQIEKSLKDESQSHTKLGFLKKREKQLQDQLLGDPTNPDDNGLLGKRQKKVVRYNKEIQEKTELLERAKSLSQQTQQEVVRSLQEIRRHLPKADDEVVTGEEPKPGFMTDKELTRMMSQIESRYRRAVGYPEGLDEYVEFKGRKAQFKTGYPDMVEVVDNLKAAIDKSHTEWDAEKQRQRERDIRQEGVVQSEQREYERLLSNLRAFQKQTMDLNVEEARRRKREADEILQMPPEEALREAVRIETEVLPARRAALAETLSIVDDEKITALNIREKVDDSQRIVDSLRRQVIDAKTPEQAQELRIRLEQQQQLLQTRQESLRIRELTDTHGLSIAAKRKILTEAVGEAEQRARIAETYAYTALPQEGADLRRTIANELAQAQQQVDTLQQKMEGLRQRGEEDSTEMRSLRTELEKVYSDKTIEGLQRKYDMFSSIQEPIDRTADRIQFRTDAERDATKAHEEVTRLQLDLNKLEARRIAGEDVELQTNYLRQQLQQQQQNLEIAEERMKGEVRQDVTFDELAQQAVYNQIATDYKRSYDFLRSKHLQEQEALTQARGLLQEDLQRRLIHTIGEDPQKLADDASKPGPDDTDSVYKQYEKLFAPSPELAKYLDTKRRMITYETERVNNLIRDGWATKEDNVAEMETIARMAGIDIRQDYKVEAHKQGIHGLETEIQDIAGKVSTEAEQRTKEIKQEYPYIFREYKDFIAYDTFESEKTRLGDELEAKKTLLEQGNLSLRNIPITTDLIRKGRGASGVAQREEDIRQQTQDFVERELRRKNRDDLADQYRDEHTNTPVKDLPAELKREVEPLYRSALINQHDMTLFEARRNFAIGQDPTIVDSPEVQFRSPKDLISNIRSREGRLREEEPAHRVLAKQQEQRFQDKKQEIVDFDETIKTQQEQIRSFRRQIQREEEAARRYSQDVSVDGIGLKDLKYYLDNREKLDSDREQAALHQQEAQRLQQRMLTLEARLVGTTTQRDAAQKELRDITTNISAAKTNLAQRIQEQEQEISRLKEVRKQLEDPQRRNPIEAVYGELKDKIEDRKASIEELTKLQEFYTKAIPERIEKELAANYEKKFEEIIGKEGFIKSKQVEREEAMQESFVAAAEAVLKRRLDVSALEKKKLYDIYREASKRAPEGPTKTADTIQRAVDMYERQRNATRYRPPNVQEGIKTLQRKIREQKRIISALEQQVDTPQLQVRQAERDLAAAQRMLRILQRPEAEAMLYKTNARGITPLTITPIMGDDGRMLSPEDSYRKIIKDSYFPAVRDDLDRDDFNRIVRESKDEISYVEHGDYTITGELYSDNEKEARKKGQVPTSGFPLHPRYEETIRAARDVDKLWEHEVNIMKRGPLLTQQYKDVFELKPSVIEEISNRPEVQRARQTLADREREMQRIRATPGTDASAAIERVDAARRSLENVLHPVDAYTATNIQKIKRAEYDRAAQTLTAQQMRIQKPYETLPGETPDNMWMYRYLDLPPTLQVPRLATPIGREDEMRLWKQVHTDLPQLSQRRVTDPETGRSRLETPYETIARWHKEKGAYESLRDRLPREPLVDVQGLTSQQIRLRAERANQRSMTYKERQAFFDRQDKLSDARKKLERIEKLKKVTGKEMLDVAKDFETSPARKRLQRAQIESGEIYSPMERARILVNQQRKQDERIEELIRQGKYERSGIVETFTRAPEYLYESRQLEKDLGREEDTIRRLQKEYPESHDVLEESLKTSQAQYYARLGELQTKYPLINSEQRHAAQVLRQFERQGKQTPEQQHVKRAKKEIQEVRDKYPKYKEPGDDRVQYTQKVTQLLEGDPVSKYLVKRKGMRADQVPYKEGLYPTFWKGYKDAEGKQVVPGFETEMQKAFSQSRIEAEALPTRRATRYRPTTEDIRKRKQVADDLRNRRMLQRNLGTIEEKQFIAGQALRTPPVIVPTRRQLAMSRQEAERTISRFEQGRDAQRAVQERGGTEQEKLPIHKAMERRSREAGRLEKKMYATGTPDDYTMQERRRQARQLKYRPDKRQTVLLTPKLATKARLEQIRNVIQQNRQRISEFRDEQARERRKSRLFLREASDRARAKRREEWNIEKARRRRGRRRGFVGRVLQQVTRNVQQHYAAYKRKKQREQNVKARRKIYAQQAEQRRQQLLQTKITQYRQRTKRENISVTEKKYYLRQIGILNKNLALMKKNNDVEKSQLRY